MTAWNFRWRNQTTTFQGSVAVFDHVPHSLWWWHQRERCCRLSPGDWRDFPTNAPDVYSDCCRFYLLPCSFQSVFFVSSERRLLFVCMTLFRSVHMRKRSHVCKQLPHESWISLQKRNLFGFVRSRAHTVGRKYWVLLKVNLQLPVTKTLLLTHLSPEKPAIVSLLLKIRAWFKQIWNYTAAYDEFNSATRRKSNQGWEEANLQTVFSVWAPRKWSRLRAGSPVRGWVVSPLEAEVCSLKPPRGSMPPPFMSPIMAKSGPQGALWRHPIVHNRF
jgi:hypothetical protein